MASVVFQPANGNVNSLQCLITPQDSKPLVLHWSCFRLDADGKVTTPGFSQKVDLGAAAELSATIEADKGRVKLEYRLAPPGNSVAIGSGSISDRGIEPGTPQVVVNREMDRLTDRSSVLWAVRYVQDGKATGWYACLAWIDLAGGQDKSPVSGDQLTQAQKSLTAFVDDHAGADSKQPAVRP